MIINKIWYKSPASVLELGLSDHLAQILSITSSKPIQTQTKSWRKNFNKNNINKFTKLLEQVRWQDVNLVSEANAKFECFISKLIFLFNKAFPLRQVVVKKTYHATWIRQGIKKSSKKVRLLNELKKYMTISRRSKQYIDNYNRIYKRVLKEAKRRENDRLLLKATNKSKTIWKIIKNEIGKPTNYVQDITLDT
jgi:hypothetical protein